MTDQDLNQKSPKQKTPKKKGPLRIEAIIPLIIVGALSCAYFYLFFDSNLKTALELGGTYTHGAEVNINAIKTNLSEGRLTITDIQVTDKEHPEQNLIQIGQIDVALSWDALLRAKFVIPKASIENIQASTIRQRPGRIIPKEESDKNGGKLITEVQTEALSKMKKDYNTNILGDVASIVGGSDPSKQLEKIQSELTSEKKIKELKQEIALKEKIWKERFAKMPQKKEVDALIARGEKLKFKGNALQIAKDIEAADKILKEADQIYKTYQKTQKELGSDYSQLEGGIQGIDKLIQKDIDDLQARLKIPSLNVKDFSKGLFGNMLMQKLGSYAKYVEMGKQYMPPPKDPHATPDEALTPPTRGKGLDIMFPITSGFPLFWLQKATISSKSAESKLSGDIKGELKNATSDPQFLKKPMTLTVKGNFPHQGIRGLDALLTVDHTTPNTKDSLAMTIAEFPVDRMVLSSGKEVKFAIKKAQGATRVNAVFQNSVLHLNLINYFKKIDYDISATSAVVDDSLKAIVKGIPLVTVNAKANGEWGALNWGINSNLGDELSRGFKKQLNLKIQKAKQKLNEFVNGKISGERAKLLGQLNSSKKQLTAQVDKGKKDLENAKNQMTGQKKTAEKKGKNKVEKAAKKALDDLKKKIKLPW